jgi:hypothetical protein
MAVVLLIMAGCAVGGGDLAIRGGTLRGLALAAVLGLSAVALAALGGA